MDFKGEMGKRGEGGKGTLLKDHSKPPPPPPPKKKKKKKKKKIAKLTPISKDLMPEVVYSTSTENSLTDRNSTGGPLKKPRKEEEEEEKEKERRKKKKKKVGWGGGRKKKEACPDNYRSLPVLYLGRPAAFH